MRVFACSRDTWSLFGEKIRGVMVEVCYQFELALMF